MSAPNSLSEQVVALPAGGGGVAGLGDTFGADPYTGTGRFIELGFAAMGDDALSIQSPSSATVAPPGFYMLYVVDAAGTPSIAKFVQVIA